MLSRGQVGDGEPGCVSLWFPHDIYKKKKYKKKKHFHASVPQMSSGPQDQLITGVWLISLGATWGPCAQQLPVGPAMQWPENCGDASPGTVNQKLFIPVMCCAVALL